MPRVTSANAPNNNCNDTAAAAAAAAAAAGVTLNVSPSQVTPELQLVNTDNLFRACFLAGAMSDETQCKLACLLQQCLFGEQSTVLVRAEMPCAPHGQMHVFASCVIYS
jgi:hypothetical protein